MTANPAATHSQVASTVPPPSATAVVPDPCSGQPAVAAGGDTGLSSDLVALLRPYSPDPLSTRQQLRPCDLRAGDVILNHGRAVVTSAGWPRKGRSGHVLTVPTSHGPIDWPLADSSRFRNLDVHREVKR